MSDFKKRCKDYFGTNDLYQILSIDKSATKKDVKKAYHRLSLLVHPDRVDGGHNKELATEKFKILGKIHSILHDERTRRIYDSTGRICEDDYYDVDFDWMNYWSSIFKPINIKDIDAYKNEYVGSETELRDITKAYQATKGDMSRMLEMIPFSNCDSEPRITAIVEDLVKDEKLERYGRFFNEPKRRKEYRKRKWAKEAEEAKSIDLDALEKQMQKTHEASKKRFSDLIAGLEDKYSKPIVKKQRSIKCGKKQQK